MHNSTITSQIPLRNSPRSTKTKMKEQPSQGKKTRMNLHPVGLQRHYVEHHPRRRPDPQLGQRVACSAGHVTRRRSAGIAPDIPGHQREQLEALPRRRTCLSLRHDLRRTRGHPDIPARQRKQRQAPRRDLGAGGLSVGRRSQRARGSLQGGRALVEDGVPAVLDGVVGAAGEELGDGGPAVAVGGLVLDNEHVLLDGEGLDGLHPGVEVLAPAEAARLGVAAGQSSADGVPVVRAAAPTDLLPQQVVLSLGPHLLG
uniref:Uncharacterized protein n=1 Tax=Triticum urartu TaxID=4572 RepID=A0A8R7U9B8_TRIUA